MERVALPRFASRERVPVTTIPNFRDAGRTVDAPLLALLARLSKRHGQAYASEAGLRRMIAEDVGRCPGVTTVQKALWRLAKQGLLVQVWLRAGQVTPDGGVLAHGTRLVWLPRCRRQKRAARRWNARQDRRAGHETRMTGHQASELVGALTRATPAPSPPPAKSAAGDPIERERARQLAAALEWSRKHDPPR